MISAHIMWPSAFLRPPSDATKPLTSAIQRARKYQSSANAVPRCSATKKRQQLRRVFVDVHADQAGHEKGMAQTADREQLGHALQDAQEKQKPQSHASILFVS